MIQNYFGYMNLRESAVSGAVPANAVDLREDAGPGRASPEMTVHGSTLMSMGVHCVPWEYIAFHGLAF
ncbi:MAG: hypothetical protein GY765_08045 [bacterium]|nr:hypothetical protein [bacterium]